MDDFDKQLFAVLDGEVLKISSNSDKIAKKHAAKLAGAIKDASPYDPKDTGPKGHYKEGWKSRKGYSSIDHHEYDVYNSKKPSLTHLLEHGHIAANGLRVGVRPHIVANADAEIEAYIEDIKEHCTDDT